MNISTTNAPRAAYWSMPETDQVRAVLSIVFANHRTLPTPELNASDSGAFEMFYQAQKSIIQYFIKENKPIHFVLPAFPAKSPNKEKVIGVLPDLGEQLGLQLLDKMCRQIKEVYPAGAQVTVCFNGRVFGDLLKVSDAFVSEYCLELKKIATEELKLDTINFYDLDHLYPGEDFDAMRQKLMKTHGAPIEELKESVAHGQKARILFNSVHRFLIEDIKVLYPELSAPEVRNISKVDAYEVINRSNAWSRHIAEKFPVSVRLSIHPQPVNAQKIGIKLIEGKNVWHTPWHTTVLEKEGKVSLVRKSEIKDARLVYRNGRPSHYVANKVSRRSAGSAEKYMG